MQTRKENDEVLYAATDIVTVHRGDIGELKAGAEETARKRIRLCAHSTTQNRLHEMFIVLGKGSYIRPHRHAGKSESFHLVEGRLDIVIFDNAGNVVEIIDMGDYQSGRRFYFRIEQPVFHTVVVRSDFVIFHETTNGPFDRAATEYAPWAPEDSEIESGCLFIENVVRSMGGTRES
jgi:cupin fold WbuC family metalloprotein